MPKQDSGFIQNDILLFRRSLLKKSKRFVVLIMIISAFMSCLLDPRPVCTAEFALINIVVLDTLFSPVDSLSLSVQNVATGKQYNFNQNNVHYKGQFTVFDDSRESELTPDPAPFKVTGYKDSLSFEDIFQFYSDGCHVRKFSGPDTVIIRRNHA